MSENKKYYITTPIYYPSGKWHVGTCYTTIVCDALARFKRMQGYDVFYLTGTDEHGKKIQTKAKEKGCTEQQFVDELVGDLKTLWQRLDISYDKFIRTTDDYHCETVQKIFERLYKQGDIYKSQYEGWYCVPCESFWTKTQLVDGKCPDCGRDVELTQEESYFFRLSKYTDRIKKLFEDNPEFLQPQSRVNEMYNNFLKDGLQDLAVSRTTFDWGIKVPFDPKHVVYVWIDALTNYITALGYGQQDDTLFRRYWPADVHMMGKEIIRFHSIIWPALLMALDLPLPKKVYGHGWLLMGNEKISKSRGNIVDPFILSDRYGVDALRYYLLREIPFGSDGLFNNELFIKRINADLCNVYGNLVSRTLSMIASYNDGVIPTPADYTDLDREVIAQAEGLLAAISEDVDALNVPVALERIFGLASRLNKYIDETTPWVLAKSEEGKGRLNTVLYVLAQGLRFVSVALLPYLTIAPVKALDAFGIGAAERTFDSLVWDRAIDGIKTSKIDHLFPRYDLTKEVAAMEDIAEAEAKKADKAKAQSADNKPADKPAEQPKNAHEGVVTVSEIGIEQFAEISLKVARVVACEKVPKSNKLLQFTLDVGGETRTVLSGIAKWYAPEDLIGKNVVIVANLKPAKLAGIMSQGMILAAEDAEGNLSVITTERPVSAGATVR